MLIDDLADYILDTKYESFNNEVVEAAKKRLIDVAGCAVSGANASGNQALLNLTRKWGGKKEATILVHGDKVPLPHAAMMNSIMVRSFDHEATGPEPEGENAGKMTGHIPSTTEPTAISVAEYKGSSGKELIAAVVLGGDVAARIASAQDFSFSTSFELCGTANAFGAATIAGRLFGLNKKQMVNTFGILVNQLTGTFQSIWDGAHSFKLTGALSARNGIFSAELAAEGFLGLKDPLLSPLGYFNQYCKSYHPENLTKDLGKVFYCQAQHKVHPSCYGNHNAIECSLNIIKNHDINTDDIAMVNLVVHPSRERHFLNQPFGVDDAQPKSVFNLPYAVANALLRKAARLEHYTDEYIHEPKVLELVNKVKLVPTLQTKHTHSCRLEVIMKDGKTYTAERDSVPVGWLEDPLTREQVKDKFRRNVEFSKTVSTENAEAALKILDNIEDAANIKKLVKLLVA